jgi:hypothetical protein
MQPECAGCEVEVVITKIYIYVYPISTSTIYKLKRERKKHTNTFDTHRQTCAVRRLHQKGKSKITGQAGRLVKWKWWSWKIFTLLSLVVGGHSTAQHTVGWNSTICTSAPPPASGHTTTVYYHQSDESARLVPDRSASCSNAKAHGWIDQLSCALYVCILVPFLGHNNSNVPRTYVPLLAASCCCIDRRSIYYYMHACIHAYAYAWSTIYYSKQQVVCCCCCCTFQLEPRSECIDLPFYGVIGFLQEAEPGSPHAGGVSSVAWSDLRARLYACKKAPTARLDGNERNGRFYRAWLEWCYTRARMRKNDLRAHRFALRAAYQSATPKSQANYKETTKQCRMHVLG